MTDRLMHEQALDLMASYIDGTLPATDVDRLEPHIADCAECAALLGDQEGIDLAGATEREFDERVLHRSIRRTLLRTAGYSTILVVLVALALFIGSNLIVQPLLMNIGGRAEAAARATYDLAPMINEGTVIEEFSIDSRFASRTFTVQLGLPLGSSIIDAGDVTHEMGLGGTDPGGLWPFTGALQPNPVPGADLLERLGPSTVSTVAVSFRNPLDPADAQGLADRPGADVSVVWAGFLISAAPPEEAATDPLRTLGYSTCSDARLPDDLFASSSANVGSSFGVRSPSIAAAFEQVRGAVSHLAGEQRVLESLPLGWSDSILAADEHLDGIEAAPVETLVVTGPSDEVLRFLDEADAVNARVLATEFYNWVGRVCR